MNITLYDSLNDPTKENLSQDIDRFIASQTIMLSLAGVPGIYIHSLFGSRNYQRGVEATGQARSINREKFDFATLKSKLSQSENREGQILNRYVNLLIIRRQQSAFHPLSPQEVLFSDSGIFSIVRRSVDGKQTIFCLVNVTSVPRRFCLDAQSNELSSNLFWHDLIGGQHYGAMPSGLEINLKPYQSCWLIAV